MGTGKDIDRRYEIRQLEPQHADWAKAIRVHSLVFHSPSWKALYPNHLTKRCYDGFVALDVFLRHCIASGWSFGVFDTAYRYRSRDAMQAGGLLGWDFENVDANEQELREQMDFPLVSIALSWDGFNPPPPGSAPFSSMLPAITEQNRVLDLLDKRDPSSWAPKASGQVLMRAGTGTRIEYTGQGLMKTLTYDILHRAACAGFRGVQVRASSSAVLHVWETLSAPYKSEVICAMVQNVPRVENELGGSANVISTNGFRVARIYVTLKE